MSSCSGVLNKNFHSLHDKITTWSNLVFGTQDMMTVPFLFEMTEYVFFPDETTRLLKSSLIMQIVQYVQFVNMH